MKRVLFTLLFCLSVASIFGQAEGDYQTAASGRWNSPPTWQVFHNGAWRALNSSAAGPFLNVIPSNASGVITVRHSITVTTNTSINQTVIQAPSVMRINGGVTLRMVEDFTDAPLHLNSKASIVSLGTLDLQSQLTSTAVEINGDLISSAPIQLSNPALLVFNSGGRYIHDYASGGNVPIATWSTGSTCIIYGLTSANAAVPSNLDQVFANFIWDTPNMGATNTFSLAGVLTTVSGNLTLAATNGRVVRLSSGLPGYTLNVGGNFRVQTGLFVLTENQSSTTTINVGGNFIVASGNTILGTSNNSNLNIVLNGNFQKTNGVISRGSGTGAATFRFAAGGPVQFYSNSAPITSAINFLVEGGSVLDLGTQFLSGTGAFTLEANATLRVGSGSAVGAIQNNTVDGNIRVSGLRTYQTGSTIVYGGASPQFIGAGHPGNVNTTIDNPNNVTILFNTSLSGALNLEEGVLSIENRTLTLSGAYSRTNGSLGIRPTSNLVINGTGDLGDLVFSFMQSPNNPINNLTINRSGGTVYLGAPLVVAGTFTLSNGNFSLGQFSAYTLTLRGNFIQTGGSIAVFENSSLIIEGAGTLPANVNMTGPDMFDLTMNRPGRTFTTSSPLTIRYLNLYSGVVNNPALSISMAPDGQVTRYSTGSITNVLGTIGGSNYDVIYNVSTEIETGNELPFDFTRLGNLVKEGPARVNLNHPIQVNKAFTVSQGTFSIGDGNHVAIAQDLIVNGTLESGESEVSFIGAAPQQINAASPLTFFDVELNQSPASSVVLAGTTTLDIQNSLTITSASAFNAGTNQLRLLSTPARTANVNQLAPGASITGSVIVQRYLPKVEVRRQYHYMASPVVGATLAGWGADMPIGRAYRWDEPSQNWAPIISSSPVTNGRGYIIDVATNASMTPDARGPLGQGNIDVPLVAQATTGTSKGMNLIGNPYPSPIHWDNITVPPNVNNAIYLIDNFGNSGQGSGTEIEVSYVDGVGTPLGYTGAIAQGQAFFVFTTANTTLTFTEAAKISSSNTQFFRKPEIPNVLRIALSGNDVKDEAVIRLRDGASDNFDRQFDAFKLQKEKSNISSLTADNIKAVINALGTSECNKNIQLSTDIKEEGSYTLSFVGMESFDSFIEINLLDVVAKKTIDIAQQQTYTFNVTSENKDLILTRFQISIQGSTLAIDKSIAAVGEGVCSDRTTAFITLETSEPGVKYSAEWNGTMISEPMLGTGSLLQLPVNTSALQKGENNISIKAQYGACSMTILSTKPVITKVDAGDIKIVQSGQICQEGSATFKVTGAAQDGWYQWYDSQDSTTPIAGANEAEFTTSYLKKPKTYYVSAVNALGCEGLRIPVEAVISEPENVSLTFDGVTLTSSGTSGNQWYLNNQLLEGATSNQLEAFETGVYSVNVLQGGCSTSASYEITELGEHALISIFPNPTVDKIHIRVRTSNNNVAVTLVNNQGMEIGSKTLVGDGGSKAAEFDLLPYAIGIYNVRIMDGQKLIVKKIAKVK